MADVITWKAVHIDDVSDEVFEVGRAVDIVVDTAVDGMSRGKGRIMVRYRWKDVHIQWLVEEVVEAGERDGWDDMQGVVWLCVVAVRDEKKNG